MGISFGPSAISGASRVVDLLWRPTVVEAGGPAQHNYTARGGEQNYNGATSFIPVSFDHSAGASENMAHDGNFGRCTTLFQRTWQLPYPATPLLARPVGALKSSFTDLVWRYVVLVRMSDKGVNTALINDPCIGFSLMPGPSQSGANINGGVAFDVRAEGGGTNQSANAGMGVFLEPLIGNSWYWATAPVRNTIAQDVVPIPNIVATDLTEFELRVFSATIASDARVELWVNGKKFLSRSWPSVLLPDYATFGAAMLSPTLRGCNTAIDISGNPGGLLRVYGMRVIVGPNDGSTL